MFEEEIILLGILLSLIIGASITYSKQLRKAQREYEKAKDSVEDVVLSFNRQLTQEAERLEAVVYKIEALTAKSEGALSKAENVEKEFHVLENNVKPVFGDRDRLFGKIDALEKKVEEVSTAQETLTTKVRSVENQSSQISIASEAGLEPVIPIRRERALAPLTETELSVLEMLASEGPKTAPGIKEGIKLSREHTARLMKKLYEGGYLERETGRIPFRYSVKREMEKFLKKTEERSV